MSRDRDKRRIPTSAELEERGEVSPPTPGGGDRPGLLKRLLRARFRVPEDVAARKHVSGPPRPDFTGIGGGSPVTPDAPMQANEQSASSTKDLAATPQQEERPRSRKRAIRIDDSVKERRGLGRARNKLDDV
jgi:hypothetical protein